MGGADFKSFLDLFLLRRGSLVLSLIGLWWGADLLSLDLCEVMEGSMMRE